MADPGQRRLPFIDALRGLASVSVVVLHASALLGTLSAVPGDLPRRLMACLQLLNHGVDVFFVISGFVIAHSIADANVDRRYAACFALRRSLRLDPPYWAAIAMWFAVIFIRRHIGRAFPPYPSASQLLAHLVYLQRILGYRQIVVVFWTLCLEVQFYLIFILMIGTADRLAALCHVRGPGVRAWGTVGLFALSLLWVLGVFHVPQDLQWEHSVWCFAHWHKFLIGAIVWYAWRGYLPRGIAWVAIAMLAVAIFFAPARPLGDGPKYAHSLWAGLIAAVVFATATATGGIARWLRWTPFQMLGLISYSVYLVHVPIIEVLLGVQSRFASGSTAAALGLMALLVAVSIVAGWVMHKLIERPSIQLASRFKMKRDDLAGGLEGPATAMPG